MEFNIEEIVSILCVSEAVSSVSVSNLLFSVISKYFVFGINKVVCNEINSLKGSSHLYLYSAFNNTKCVKATAQYQHMKIVCLCNMTRLNTIFS